MEQLYLCAHCGEENEIEIEPGDGERQRLSADCVGCRQVNMITAQYNFNSNEFDLSVEREIPESL
ncbi:hypothetical protein C3F09_07715 [candidate division GN15 bacterium]|uniref:CPXCG motif-containing cysteine-rich protein n=1 Tax=candidate division GN15 bacterium TaxID=2072418 RepID=A0A855X693_9BACT|nr:MAG: hypothetical protein C3F09_07715 [candidate division GN15 bacterium]